MSDRYLVIIIGGGQAGLSVSYCLKQRGIEHIIFEKYTIGHEWRSIVNGNRSAWQTST